MEQALMQHFSVIHNSVSSPANAVNFPYLNICRKGIRDMASNVSIGKAITFDGVDDSLFNFSDGCRCQRLSRPSSKKLRADQSPCPNCLRRYTALQ
jgi:hypothetical protein